MDVMNALLNTVVVVLIASTMFGAGLGTTLGALGATFRNVKLVLLVVVANLVLVPLIGWGTAAVLSLDTPAYIALVLLACSPGAPFAAKLAMIQRGDVVTGASLQVFLAAIGSLTFAPTANAIFTAANLWRRDLASRWTTGPDGGRLAVAAVCGGSGAPEMGAGDGDPVESARTANLEPGPGSGARLVPARQLAADHRSGRLAHAPGRGHLQRGRIRDRHVGRQRLAGNQNDRGFIGPSTQCRSGVRRCRHCLQQRAQRSSPRSPAFSSSDSRSAWPSPRTWHGIAPLPRPKPSRRRKSQAQAEHPSSAVGVHDSDRSAAADR